MVAKVSITNYGFIVFRAEDPILKIIHYQLTDLTARRVPYSSLIEAGKFSSKSDLSLIRKNSGTSSKTGDLNFISVGISFSTGWLISNSITYSFYGFESREYKEEH